MMKRKYPAHGDVNHSSTLCKDISTMHLSDDYSDVTLIVCGERFNSHKNILAARSQYFRALFSGGFKDSTQQEIELKDASLDGFKGLLEYIYTGRLSLTDRNEEVTLDILRLTHMYGFSELETSISVYFSEILDINNVCLVFNAALLHGSEFLTRACHEYMDEHAREVMKHESFLQLSPDALDNLLSRDSLCAPEIDIFLAVQAWLEANPDAESKSILDKVQLSLISVKNLSKVVWDSKLYSAETILNAVRVQTETNLNYRGRSLINVNVADLSYGAKVLRGESSEYLLNGDSTNFDDDEGYTTHAITDSAEGILVKLGTQYLINHIKMLLWDRDRRLYCYYVEVSIDQKYWVRVVDYRDYTCRSWQYLYFEPRVVRYIRIVGTRSGDSKNSYRNFRLVSFEAYYTNHTQKHHKGFVIPTENVATILQGATYIADPCRFGDLQCLLTGDTYYGRDYGFVESSYILIQLGQPYMIDSMRLLLWDLNQAAYSYKIEVSGNCKNWIVVADKTREDCRSWQTIRFNFYRRVVGIRITGSQRTDKTLTDVRCVHFECPAQENDKVTSESTTQIGKR